MVLRLDIESNSSQAQRDIQRLNNQLDNIQTSTAASARSLEGFGRAARTAATAAAAIGTALLSASAVTRAADSYRRLGTQLRLAVGEGAALATALNDVNRIALETRSQAEDLGSLYNRLSRAGQALNRSQQDTATATRAIAQSIQISGASATSAQAAIIQLGQGLASGQLRGEELNSVLEQTPRLAQAIADELEVNVGMLRAIAQEGRLTSEVVFSALVNQAATINREFGSVAITVQGAFSQLTFGTTRFLANLDMALGTSDTLIRRVQSIAFFFNDAADSVSLIGPALNVVQASFTRFTIDAASSLRTLRSSISDLFVVDASGLTINLPSLDELRAGFDDLFAGLTEAIEVNLGFTFPTVADIRSQVNSFLDSIRNAVQDVLDFQLTVNLDDSQVAVFSASIGELVTSAVDTVLVQINRLSGIASAVGGFLRDQLREWTAWANELVFGSIVPDVIDAVIAQFERLGGLSGIVGSVVSSVNGLFANLSFELPSPQEISDQLTSVINAGNGVAVRINNFITEQELSVPDIDIGTVFFNVADFVSTAATAFGMALSTINTDALLALGFAIWDALEAAFNATLIAGSAVAIGRAIASNILGVLRTASYLGVANQIGTTVADILNEQDFQGLAQGIASNVTRFLGESSGDNGIVNLGAALGAAFINAVQGTLVGVFSSGSDAISSLENALNAAITAAFVAALVSGGVRNAFLGAAQFAFTGRGGAEADINRRAAVGEGVLGAGADVLGAERRVVINQATRTAIGVASALAATEFVEFLGGGPLAQVFTAAAAQAFGANVLGNLAAPLVDGIVTRLAGIGVAALAAFGGTAGLAIVGGFVAALSGVAAATLFPEDTRNFFENILGLSPDTAQLLTDVIGFPRALGNALGDFIADFQGAVRSLTDALGITTRAETTQRVTDTAPVAATLRDLIPQLADVDGANTAVLESAVRSLEDNGMLASERQAIILGEQLSLAQTQNLLTQQGFESLRQLLQNAGGPAFQTGGRVRGPGTGRSDSILARVSNGEFVVNAEATRRNLGLLTAINGGNFDGFGNRVGGLPGFQTGGLVDLIRMNEGFRRNVYLDSEGLPTVGTGHLLTRSELARFGIPRNITQAQLNASPITPYTDAELEALLQSDLGNAMADARAFVGGANFDALPARIHDVLIDLAFNLGRSRLSGFVNFRQSLIDQDFDMAAADLLDSRYANQVPNRANRNADIIRSFADIPPTLTEQVLEGAAGIGRAISGLFTFQEGGPVDVNAVREFTAQNVGNFLAANARNRREADAILAQITGQSFEEIHAETLRLNPQLEETEGGYVQYVRDLFDGFLQDPSAALVAYEESFARRNEELNAITGEPGLRRGTAAEAANELRSVSNELGIDVDEIARQRELFGQSFLGQLLGEGRTLNVPDAPPVASADDIQRARDEFNNSFIGGLLNSLQSFQLGGLIGEFGGDVDSLFGSDFAPLAFLDRALPLAMQQFQSTFDTVAANFAAYDTSLTGIPLRAGTNFAFQGNLANRQFSVSYPALRAHHSLENRLAVALHELGHAQAFAELIAANGGDLGAAAASRDATDRLSREARATQFAFQNAGEFGSLPGFGDVLGAALRTYINSVTSGRLERQEQGRDDALVQDIADDARLNQSRLAPQDLAGGDNRLGLGGILRAAGRYIHGDTISFQDLEGFQNGGRVRGPGTGTSDSILARLSNGEFVVNAAATRQNLGLLQRINNGGLPGFQAGGLIGGLQEQGFQISEDAINGLQRTERLLLRRQLIELERLTATAERSNLTDLEMEQVAEQQNILLEDIRTSLTDVGALGGAGAEGDAVAEAPPPPMASIEDALTALAPFNREVNATSLALNASNEQLVRAVELNNMLSSLQTMLNTEEGLSIEQRRMLVAQIRETNTELDALATASLGIAGNIRPVVSDITMSLASNLSRAIATGDFSNLGDTLRAGILNALQSRLQMNIEESLNIIFDSFADQLFTSVGSSVQGGGSAGGGLGSIFGGLFGGGGGGGFLGGIFGFQEGGVVPNAPGTGDRVPALLSPGELIVPPENFDDFENGQGMSQNVTINISGNVDQRAIDQIRAVISSSPQQVGASNQMFMTNTRGLMRR